MLKKRTSKKSNHHKSNHRKSKKEIKKYILKGGLGNNKQYWNQHPSFIETNKRLKDTVVLSTIYRNENSQYSLYKPLLDNLLKINNGIINMDFISNFARNIYYDNGKRPVFEISLDILNPGGQQEAKWVNPMNQKYQITKAFTQKHGNTSILFLDDPKKINKVLKIFNNIDVDVKKIKDYLSMNVSEIKPSIKTFEFSIQKNYLLFSEDNFNIINFNMDNNFIESNKESKLYLSVKNNDAINDYIINLILQNINESMPREEKIKFVKYDNLFVTRVNGVYRYCIIMEKMEGSLDNYIENELKFNDQSELYRIFSKVETELNKLKTKQYLFTHTDMKVENVFYKKIERRGGPPRIEPYLADFDKSSITFHNIRFYNDISVSGGIKSYTDPTKFIGNYLQDSYTKSMGIHRKHLLNIASNNVSPMAAAENNRDSSESSNKDIGEAAAAANNRGAAAANNRGAAAAAANNRGAAAAAVNNSIGIVNGRNISLKYGLSRFGIEMAARIGIDRIETEQTYMRYNLTPYYTSFDMAILLCSLFNKKKIDKIDPRYELYNLIRKYIAEDKIITIFDMFNIASFPRGQTGNFGLLTGLLIGSTLTEDYFIHTYVYEPPNPFINRLYKTNVNKIALTIPFVPTSEKYHINIGHSEDEENTYDRSALVALASATVSVAKTPFTIMKGVIDKCRQGDDTVFKCNSSETKKLYRQIDDPQMKLFLDSLTTHEFIVEYNIDYCAGRGVLIPLPKFILKTNRYSFTDKSSKTRVYDYDNITEPEIIPALRFFLTIRNRAS
jgi:hypothetical protein